MSNVEKEEAFKKLETLLKTFDIPSHKQQSVGWLIKNLKKRNLNNPLFQEVTTLLNNMKKQGWTVY